MIRLPDLILRELAACESAMQEYQNGFPEPIQKKRDRLAKLIDQYWPEPKLSPGRDDNRTAEIAAMFLSSANLNLPSRRRPTLQEYESRRPKQNDLYKFGIYREY